MLSSWSEHGRLGPVGRSFRGVAVPAALALLALLVASPARAEILVDSTVFAIDVFAGRDKNGDDIILDEEADLDEVRRSGVLSFSETLSARTRSSRASASQTSNVSTSATTLRLVSNGSCEGSAEQGDEATQGDGSAQFELRFTLTAPARLSVTGSIRESGLGAVSGGGRIGVSDALGLITYPDLVPDLTQAIAADALLDPGSFYFVGAFCGADTHFRPGFGGEQTASASWSMTLRLTEGDQEEDDCEGSLLAWVGGRSGAFADPENWEPPKVPAFEEGGDCDTALVRGGRNVTIDLGAVGLARLADPLDPRGGGVARKAGRLVVYDSEGLRTPGGTLTLDALSPDLGARSLEIGDDAELFVAAGRVVARHVELGAEGPGELEVVGPGGSFENTGRLGVGATGEGRLLVRQGAQMTSAEAVLGELDEPGAAVVQDAGTVWSTANLAVGLAHDATLEILDGARVESDQTFVDFLLDGDETASGTVRGKDAQGNRATWSAQTLQVGKRGSVAVEDGGFLDVAGNLHLAWGDAGAQGINLVAVRPGGQLAASSLDLGGTMVLSGDALALVTQYVAIGDAAFPSAAATLLLQGPSTGPQLDGPTDLTIEALGRAALLNGARANLFGTFIVGLDLSSDAGLRVVAGQGGTGEPSVLRAAVTAPQFSVVGATADAPAGVYLEPTGRLLLEGGRIELTGPEHNLRIGRRGILTGRGGTISIEPPGKLVNRGVIEGGFTLDGSYEQVPGAMVFGQILAPGGTPLNRAALDPLAAAAFPRRAVRKKPAPPSFGPLVVTGDASLDGRVALQFGNGVAPRMGESFAVLDVAGDVTGEFAEVSIQGLEPGSFAFEPSQVGGKLSLTSLTDAVALPAVSVKAKARLKETAKKGGKIKLKRKGDTSAPLLVSYRVRGSAQSGVDYEALPGTIEIPARKKKATIVLKPIADGVLEGPETIEIELVPNDTFAPGLVSGATIELLSKDK